MVLDDLRRPLLKRMQNELPGVHGLVVSDREGGVLLRCVRDDRAEQVDAFTRPPFLGSYAQCAEKASRLMLGPSHTMVVSVSGLTVVHSNHDPLVLTILADPKEAIIGQMLDFAKSLKPLVEDMSKSCD